MASRRQNIITAVKTRFAAIRATNGYATNIGQRVEEFRTTPFDASELPAINLLDTVEPVSFDNKNRGSHLRQLTVVANLVLAESAHSATQARAALADVEKAIASDPRWGGLATRTLPKQGRLMVDDKGLWLGGAQVEFVIEYFTAPWEP